MWSSSRMFNRLLHRCSCSCQSHSITSQIERNYSFITTPIFYVNSYPHIGHLYSLLLADAGHRFHKLKSGLGFEKQKELSLFTTGTDEHGQKVQRAAEAVNLNVNQHCNNVSHAFRTLCHDFTISNTDFIRTTESRHAEAVSEFWKQLVDSGKIYKGKYEGWYSVSDEAFFPKSHPIVDKIGLNGNVIKVSSETGQVVEWLSEENYMFSINFFSSSIRDWIKKENPIQPEIFTRPVLKWLENDSPELSVSRPRSRLSWGIPVPGDPSQVIYVWLDALINYLTVTGYPGKRFQWPPTVQIVGKDILKFHAYYWPAFLLAAGLELPKKILCHSHWTIDNVKMSKSLGNVVDPNALKSKYGVDALRYFLLREGVPHSDGNFNEEKMIRMVNAELADTLGNLLSRCTASALNPNQIWPEFSESSFSKLSSPNGLALRESVELLLDKVDGSYANYNFYRGIEHIMATLRTANLFVEEEKPWVLVKVSPRQESLLVMTSVVMETLRICGTVLLPVTPTLATHLLDRLNVDEEKRNWNNLRPFIWEKSKDEKSLQNKTSILFRRIHQKG